MDRIDYDDQFLVVEVWCKIETRRAEIQDVHSRRVVVLATKGLDSERTKAIVAEEDIP
jgi:hypothetical protein